MILAKNLKIFLIFFILAAIFYFGSNANNARLFTAQVNQNQWELIRKESVPNPGIAAVSALSAFVDKEGKESIIFEKEKNKPLPIASLTKLMLAKIVLENYDPNEIVKISEKAADLPGNGYQRLKAGQTFRAIDLLYSALIESNNTSALALAEVVGQKKFVTMMNSEAENLGMINTYFQNPMGLDEAGHYSTVSDLLKLTENLLQKKSFIWNIISLPEFKLYSAQGEFLHSVISTNELLKEIPSIVGGKTGETPKAGGCLLLVSEAPNGRGYLINIVLNSKNRFEEIKKLLAWDEASYLW